MGVELGQLAIVVPSALLLWRSGGPLGEHVHSATLALVEFLRSDQSQPAEPQMADLLRGLGNATAIRLTPGASAIDMSIAQLDLRAVTGASVLAIASGDEDVTAPTGDEILKEGDVLALAGPNHAVQEARELLLGGAGVAVDEPFTPSP